MFYWLARLYLSIDQRITKWVATDRGQHLLIGLSLGYASAGLFSVWESWYTRSVLGIVLGLVYSLSGIAFATFLSLRLTVEKNIDKYASNELLRQADNDRDGIITEPNGA